MKVTYEFNLPEESTELKIHTNALDNYSALIEIRERIRRYEKYEEGKMTEVLRYIKDELNDLELDL